MLSRILKLKYLDLMIGIFIFAYISYFQAWLSDDAFISFRVVDNFVNGHGLRWNIAERVQVFTNPLLVLILSPLYFLWRNIIAISFITSFLFGIGSIYLLKKIAVSRLSFVISILFLFSSVTFFDYVFSGLENSLNYLIEASFFYYLWKDEDSPKSKLPICTFLISTAAVSRFDSVLIFAIPYIVLLYSEYSKNRINRKVILLSILGLLPIILWLLFSGIYFGSFLPNTYYAKTNILEPLSDIVFQGLKYFKYQFFWDPISFIFIPLVFLIHLAFKQLRWALPIAILYVVPFLIYILFIGGDFMAGRFFTSVVFFFGLALARVPFELKDGLITILLVIIYNFLFQFTPIYVDQIESLSKNFVDGIANEKNIYYSKTAFRHRNADGSILYKLARRAKLYKVDDSVVLRGQIGIFGYSLGPNYHIIDFYALSDALLSRLRGYGRVGHKKRFLPKGYIEGIKSGKNEITDLGLKEYYDGIRILTREHVWDKRRLDLFWKYQFGKLRKYDVIYEFGNIQIENSPRIKIDTSLSE